MGVNGACRVDNESSYIADICCYTGIFKAVDKLECLFLAACTDSYYCAALAAELLFRYIIIGAGFKCGIIYGNSAVLLEKLGKLFWNCCKGAPF